MTVFRFVWVLATVVHAAALADEPALPIVQGGTADPARLILVEQDAATFRSVMAALDLDVARFRDGAHEVIAWDGDLAALDAAGVPYRVVVPDLTASLQSRLLSGNALNSQPPAALGAGLVPPFGQGSMGGYYTYDEIVSILDQLAAQYPALITPRQSLGQSLEGRDIWAVKISDNPGIDEDEPEVRMDTLHHAREPQGMQSLLWFMFHLLENHGSDEQATYLVKERELWFILVVNPDGYVYNQQIAPLGGGMWRKNRRDNGDGSIGVDLNRNYPFQWGYDDVGSSPTPSSPTYRGPLPMSEPETAAMAAFISAHDFETALSIHCYGNEWLAPWGYIPQGPPNNDEFDEVGALATEVNGYVYGPGSIVLYPTNGSTKDYDRGVHDTLGWTPEIGSSNDNFWPPTSRIVPLAEENLVALQRTALAAGAWVRATDVTVTEAGDGDGHFEGGEALEMTVAVRNSGRAASTTPVTVTLSTDSAWATVTSAVHDYGTVGPFAGADNGGAPLRLAFAPGAPGGERVDYVLTLSYDGRMVEASQTAVLGTRRPLLMDDVETELGWIVGLPSDGADTGLWERGEPVGTTDAGQPSNPAEDNTPGGTFAFVTGNGGGSAGSDDVDGGPTTLITPRLDLAWGRATISYARWFGNVGSNVDDVFEVSLSNDDGQSWVPVETLAGNHNAWTPVEWLVEDLLPLTDEMRLRFVASDEPNNSVVEAAIDDLRVDVFADVPLGVVYGTAETGTALTFNVSGEAGDVYTWLLSHGTDELLVAGIEQPLLLELATLRVLVFGVVPAGGLGRLELEVPDDPDLVGITAYVQALVERGGTPYLTNRDELTVE